MLGTGLQYDLYFVARRQFPDDEGGRERPRRGADGDDDHGFGLGRARTFLVVLGGAGIDGGRLRGAGTAGRAHEAVAAGGPDLVFGLLRGLLEGYVKLALAKLLDGDGKGVLRA